jgi:hypothetical protein
MAEAKSRENWAHTSAILAMTANVNRDPKKTKPFGPADFNPYEVAKRKTVTGKADLTILKTVFVDKERKK